MTDSSTGGFLAPLTAPQAEDDDLDDILQPSIAAITGMDPTLVRPKWQGIPGQQPDRTVTWCAFGFTIDEADINPSMVFDPTADNGQGRTAAFRTEFFEVMASFYGPACRLAAARLRDGLAIAQNREAVQALGLSFISVERMTRVPDLTNTEFINRVDLVMRFRRMRKSVFAIRSVERLAGELIVDGQSTQGPAILGEILQTG